MIRLDGWLAAHGARLVRILLLLQICGLAFFVAGAHGIFTKLPDPPTTTDFASFYAAGSLARAGHAPLAYDEAAHRHAEEQAVAPGVDEKRFLNPPPFLLVCAPLATLPYLPAFLLFEALTFALWLALTTRIAGGSVMAAAWLSAIPAVPWALGWGQNSFLSASLMGAGTWLLRTKPLLAGAAFGALCFKPHWGVLIPVALLAARQWRAILGAILSVAVICAAVTACYGVVIWRAYLGMLRGARHAVEIGIQLSGHVDTAGAARLLGMPATLSWLLQLAISLVAAAIVFYAWSRLAERRNPSPEQRAAAYAALVAGTLVAMPFVLFYDLVMAGVAAAWLAQAARLAGWRSGERAWLAIAFLSSLLAFPAAALAHVAVGALCGPILLALAMTRFVKASTKV